MTTVSSPIVQPSESNIINLIVHLLLFTASALTALEALLTAFAKMLAAAAGHRASPMTYRHEQDAIKLQETPFFVSLLEDLRNHFLLSKSTRLIYAEVSFLALGPEIRKDFKKPTEKDFYEYIFNHWPTFSSFQGPASGEIIWGWVEKGYLEPNEVNILSSIVESAAACKHHSPGLPLNLYRLIITAIILHEISHSFTKHYFKEIDTSLGVGVGEKGSQKGESGWLVEEKVFSGRLAVEWNDKSEVGKMGAIDHVVLTSGSESWAIAEDVATKYLSSLRTPTLDWPANLKTMLMPHFPTSGSARARLTETTKLVPTTKTASIGLGFDTQVGQPEAGPFRSYIGYDRRS